MSWMKGEVSDGNTWELAKWNWRSPTSRMRPFFVSAVWCATPAPSLCLTRNLILAEPGQVRPTHWARSWSGCSRQVVYSISICCVIVPSTHTFWQPMIYEQEKGQESFPHVSLRKVITIYICIYLYRKYNCTQVVPCQYILSLYNHTETKRKWPNIFMAPTYFMGLKSIVVFNCVFQIDGNHNFNQTICSLTISSINSYLHTTTIGNFYRTTTEFVPIYWQGIQM